LLHNEHDCSNISSSNPYPVLYCDNFSNLTSIKESIFYVGLPLGPGYKRVVTVFEDMMDID